MSNLRSTFFKTTPAFTVGVVALVCCAFFDFIAQGQITRIPDKTSVQMTNVIPANVFLTDDGFLFWYRKHGERVVDVKKINEAEKSPESRPAEQDMEGHWGEVMQGLQISLRFEKQIFTNGEHIDAIVLIRNVTNQPAVYIRSTQVLAFKDGKVLKRKDDDGIISISAPLEVNLFPQTQKKNLVRIDQIYDLTNNGEYYFQAVCRHPEVKSQKVKILIKN
jgi:hypothetical protein